MAPLNLASRAVMASGLSWSISVVYLNDEDYEMQRFEGMKNDRQELRKMGYESNVWTCLWNGGLPLGHIKTRIDSGSDLYIHDFVTYGLSLCVCVFFFFFVRMGDSKLFTHTLPLPADQLAVTYVTIYMYV